MPHDDREFHDVSREAEFHFARSVDVLVRPADPRAEHPYETRVFGDLGRGEPADFQFFGSRQHCGGYIICQIEFFPLEKNLKVDLTVSRASRGNGMSASPFPEATAELVSWLLKLIRARLKLTREKNHALASGEKKIRIKTNDSST